MRTGLLYAFAGTTFLTTSGMECCGVGAPALRVLAPDLECSNDCAFAIGSEAPIQLEYDELVAATLDAPQLADLEVQPATVFATTVLIRPRLEGVATLSVEGRSGGVLTWNIVTAPLATTTVVADRRIQGFTAQAPATRKQMFAGSTLRVVAEHRDAQGRRLLGHGLETWTVSGATLVPPADFEPEPELVREVIASDVSPIVVNAGTSAPPLEIDVRPAGSTRRLGLRRSTGHVVATDGSFDLVTGEFAAITVEAFTANLDFIHGVPPGGAVTISSDQPSVAEATTALGRGIHVTAKQRGTAHLTVTFDGVTAQFTVHVQ